MAARHGSGDGKRARHIRGDRPGSSSGSFGRPGRQSSPQPGQPRQCAPPPQAKRLVACGWAASQWPVLTRRCGQEHGAHPAGADCEARPETTPRQHSGQQSAALSQVLPVACGWPVHSRQCRRWGGLCGA